MFNYNRPLGLKAYFSPTTGPHTDFFHWGTGLKMLGYASWALCLNFKILGLKLSGHVYRVLINVEPYLPYNQRDTVSLWYNTMFSVLYLNLNAFFQIILYYYVHVPITNVMFFMEISLINEINQWSLLSTNSMSGSMTIWFV